MGRYMASDLAEYPSSWNANLRSSGMGPQKASMAAANCTYSMEACSTYYQSKL